MAVPTSKVLPEDKITITVPFIDHTGKSDQKGFELNRENAEKSKFFQELMESGKTTVTITELELPDLVNAALDVNMKHMLKFSLNQLCNRMSSISEEYFKTIQQKIPEFIVPLLHCGNDTQTQNWNLSEEEKGKRKTFMTQCPQSPSKNSDYIIINPSLNCLNYIKDNILDVVFNSSFWLVFKDLNQFARYSNILQSLEMSIALDSSQYAGNLNLLYYALYQMPNINIFIWRCLKQNDMIDLSEFPDMPRLEGLYINHCQLENLPYFFERDFPRLKILNLCYNEIKTLPTIHSMPKLLKLDLSWNQIENVDGLMKANFPELLYLSLQKNKIKNVPKIESMPNLSILDLSFNRISNALNFFKSELTKLRDLRLQHNKMKAIPKIESMPELLILMLSSNQVNDVSKFMKSELNALKILSLQDNRIKTIPKIESMRELTAIDLSKNEIRSISDLLKSELPNLEELILNENKIQTIPVIEAMPNLERVYIRFNQLLDIEHVDVRIREKLIGLEEQNPLELSWDAVWMGF